jgi:hypothetical protein
MFTKAYREYIKRWAEKSPTPYDFIYTMEDVSGEDLSWLWNPWLFNYGNADLGFGEMKGDKITINKIGTRPVPVKIDVFYKDGGTSSAIMNAKVWENASTFDWKITSPDEVDYVILSQGVPDEDPLNNIFPSLKEIYKNKTINPAIAGEYALDQYPVSLFIEEKDGIYTAAIPQAGLGGEMLPVTNTSFRTTDGIMTVDLVEEDGKFTKANISVQGFKLTATKK